MKFCIVKHLKNDIHSPIANYVYSRTDSDTNSEVDFKVDNDRYNFSKDERTFIFNNDNARVYPLFCFGSYSTTLIFPDNDSWDSQELSLGASHGGDVEVAGDISISTHGYTLIDWESDDKQDHRHDDAAKNKEYEKRMYTLIDSAADENDKNAEGGYLSNKPYLAHIAVVLCPEFFKDEANWTSDVRQNDDSKCEVSHKRIAEVLDNTVKDFIDTLEDKSSMRYRILGSLHTADYVIVVRAEKPETIFQLSSKISEDSNRYTTNSILSMDIVPKDDTVIEYLRPKLSNMENVSFTLSFSATMDFLPELDTNCNLNLQKGEGALLGFHDINIQLSAREFACLYPALCNNRLFKNGYDWEHNTAEFRKRAAEYTNNSVNECLADCKNCRANGIGLEISKSLKENCRIWSQNITLLCNAACLKNSGNEEDSNPRLEMALRTRSKTIEYIRRVLKLRSDQIYISKSRQLYISSVNVLLDLVKVYIPMSEQADLYLTGAIVCEYIGYLIDGIEKAVAEIKQLEGAAAENKEYDGLRPGDCRVRSLVLSERVVNIIRSGVDAINTFSRLTMGVNLQFLNAANYELLSKTSAHKLLSAYYEFSHELSNRFAENYTEQDFLENEKQEYKDDYMFSDRRISVLPIPRLSTGSPEAEILYPHGFLKRKKDEILPPYYPAVVRFPNIDMFLRVYTIVPYLRHEFAHFLRKRRKEDKSNERRNEFLLNFALREVAHRIVFNMAEQADAEYVTILGDQNATDSLYWMLVSSIREVLRNAYFASGDSDDKRKERFSFRMFSELRSTLIIFLKTLLAKTTPNESRNMTRLKGVDQLFELIDMYVSYDSTFPFTKESIKQLKSIAYSITYETLEQATQESEQTTELQLKCKELLESISKAQFAIYDQIVVAIERTNASICITETELAKTHISTKEREELMSLKAAKISHKQSQELTLDTFVSEWKIAERLFYSSLRKQPYREPDHDSDKKTDKYNYDFASQFESDMITSVSSALDSCIRTLTQEAAAANPAMPPIALLKEFSRMQLWMSQKGKQVPKFWMLPEEIIENCVKDAFTIYNEARSDIFMGTTLKFTPIGYAYLSVQNISRNISSVLDEIFYRRHQYAMFALCADDDTKTSSVNSIHMMYNSYSEDYELLMKNRTESIYRRFKKLIIKIVEDDNYKKRIRIAYFKVENDKEADGYIIQLNDSSDHIDDEMDSKSILDAIKDALDKTAYELNKDYLEMCDRKMSFITIIKHDVFAQSNHTAMSVLADRVHLKPIKRIYNRIQQLRAKNNPKLEPLINYVERNLAYCIEQIAELYMLNSLLYKIYCLPACTDEEIMHLRTVADIHKDKMKETEMTKRNETINGIIERIGSFYNGRIIIHQRDMIEDDIRFIFEFYWKNRARMAKLLLENPDARIQNPTMEIGGDSK